MVFSLVSACGMCTYTSEKMSVLWTMVTSLLTLSLLVSKCAAEVGCQTWDVISQDEICCRTCYPGYRRVARCGKEVASLCTPCRPGYFTPTDSPWSCEICRQCVDPQVLSVPCQGSTDTKCGCKTGYRCTNEDCTTCTRECGQGQQPKRGRCETCPEGTFNNQIHHQCISWTKCPPGQVVLTNGTSSFDVQCGPPMKTTTAHPIAHRSRSPRVTPEVRPDSKPEDDVTFWIWMPVAVFCILAFVAISALLRQIRIRKSTLKAVPPEHPKSPVPAHRMRVEQEEWSFCQPQQEQGSLDSLSTQDSTEKLMHSV